MTRLVKRHTFLSIIVVSAAAGGTLADQRIRTRPGS